MRYPTLDPDGLTLQAKKQMKLKGVTDRSLQFRTLRTRSSILLMVLGSNTNLAPSIYKKINLFRIMALTEQLKAINVQPIRVNV